MSVGLSLIELREMSDADPASEEALELIGRLVESEGSRSEARERAYKFLNEEPKNHLVRLLLAKSFYLDRLGEFCVRELQEIKRRGGTSESLLKLLDAFGGNVDIPTETLPEAADKEGAEGDDEQNVVAELDLDSDFTDALDELLEEED